jgi:DHA3 family tetracycline resistance protein-like MFS transporter
MRTLNAKTVYWISTFVSGFILSIVFAANQLYRIQTVGLNAMQLVLVGTTLEVTAFLLEVPTGIIADLYSRKLSVIIGTFLFGIGFLVEAWRPVFGIVLLAQVVWGSAWTFISGAHEAWITDEVGVSKVGSVFLRGSQFYQAGNLLGIPLFIWLANISYRLPIIVGGLLFLCLGVFRWLGMPETGFSPTLVEERETWRSMRDTLVSGIRMAKAKRALLIFAIISVFVGLYSEGYDRLSEAHFIQSFDFPKLPWGRDPIVSWFALIRLAGIGLSIGATQITRMKLDLFNIRRVTRLLQGLYSLIAIGLLIFAWGRNFYLAIFAVLLIDTARDLTGPLVDTWVNQLIDSRVRATMLSMTSQLDAFGQMFGGPLVGAVGSIKNIAWALSTSALLILPVVPLYHKAISVEQSRGEQPDGDG